MVGASYSIALLIRYCITVLGLTALAPNRTSSSSALANISLLILTLLRSSYTHDARPALPATEGDSPEQT
jgi:hypothetical protein